MRNGDLDGILLTGLASVRAVDLLQNYINRTADVQTACLAAIYLRVLRVPRIGGAPLAAALQAEVA